MRVGPRRRESESAVSPASRVRKVMYRKTFERRIGEMQRIEEQIEHQRRVSVPRVGREMAEALSSIAAPRDPLSSSRSPGRQ